MKETTVPSVIYSYLKKLETDEQIKVLYAVESGSRAWGFESPDSDYDIRFVYVHEQDWYLSVQHRRDVIEAMIEPDLDFAGWDLPKALLLLRKSNPSLLEWLGSPIVYVEDNEFMAEFRDLAVRCTSLNACLRHYLHTAESNWRSYFASDHVRIKKYFYVLRPIFACRWIERRRSVPPVAFGDLLNMVGEPGAIAEEVEDLLRAKALVSESGTAERRPLLDSFIEFEMQRIRGLKLESRPPIDVAELDGFFRTQLSKL